MSNYTENNLVKLTAEGVPSGTLAMKIGSLYFIAGGDASIIYTNVTASTWVTSTEYEDYPYECAIPIELATANSYPDVVFANAQATSGDYSPVSKAGTGTVTIYSKVNTTITIPQIRIY